MADDEDSPQVLWRWVCLNCCLAREDPTACEHGVGCLFAAFERVRKAEGRAQRAGHRWLTELQVRNLLAAAGRNGKHGD